MRVCIPALITIALLTPVSMAVAQTRAPHPEPPLRDSIAAEWTGITGKLITMAEDFPESAEYDFKPVEGVRTFADQLRHVAFWNMYVAKTMKGEKIDPAVNELSKTEYPSESVNCRHPEELRRPTRRRRSRHRKRCPRRRRRVCSTRSPNTQASTTDSWSCTTRLNGIVPPESRPQK